MTIIFLSNCLNHHQLPVCLEFEKMFGTSFKFIATTKISDARLKLGYDDMNHKYKFVVRAYENSESLQKAKKLCDEADIVITGSAPEWYLKRRKKENKLIFRYAERPLKRGLEPIKYMPRLIKWNFLNPFYKEIYMLCASAYTSADYSKFGLFKGKCYKWGYFPEVKKYSNIDDLIFNKQTNSLLWAGRFLKLKHPEMAIEVAKRLKNDGYEFKLNIIGNGQLKEYLEELIKKENLSNYVFLKGAMPPDRVRQFMEQSEIFLFTSDRNEGWGAVLNESMNSACAVVASNEIGSVPFLINDGSNGLIYQGDNANDLYRKVKKLLDNPTQRKQMAKNAYETMVNEWNAENAVKKFINIATEILNGNKSPELFDSGVCSKAEIIKNSWYKH